MNSPNCCGRLPKSIRNLLLDPALGVFDTVVERGKFKSVGRDKVVTKTVAPHSAKARANNKAFDRWLTLRLRGLSRELEAEPLPIGLRRLAARALKPAK